MRRAAAITLATAALLIGAPATAQAAGFPDGNWTVSGSASVSNGGNCIRLTPWTGCLRLT